MADYSPSEKVGMFVCSGLLILLSTIGLCALAWVAAHFLVRHF